MNGPQLLFYIDRRPVFLGLAIIISESALPLRHTDETTGYLNWNARATPDMVLIVADYSSDGATPSLAY